MSPSTDVVVLENEEDVAEAVHSKRKKKDKDQEKKEPKEKQSTA